MMIQLPQVVQLEMDSAGQEHPVLENIWREKLENTV